MPDRISAFTIVIVPAIVTGALAAARGIEHIPTGIPASAKIRIASIGGPSQCSGEIEHWKLDRIGCSRSATALPATAVTISTMPLALKPSIAVICWMCFDVLISCACVSCIGRTGTGMSFALTSCHMNETSGRASAIFVRSARSCFVPRRRFFVSRSITSAGQPSVPRNPRSPSRTMSSSRSRAASVNVRGTIASFSSTNPGSKRIRLASKSTCWP